MNEQERLEVVHYRIDKSNATLSEVEFLIESELWNTALNRLYYACYYAVIALLVNNHIQTKSHSGVNQMFGLHFIKTGILQPESGKFYSYLFALRHTGDYEDFSDFKKEDVIGLVQPATELIAAIQKLLT